jgi:hypothetical protein
MRVLVDIPPGPGGAAMYLAWCAFPGAGEDDAERRRKWAAAAVVSFYKRGGKRPPPELRGHKKENATGLYKRGLKRLQCRRRLAVWLAVRQMQPAARGGLNLSDAIAEQLDLLPGSYGYANDEANVRRLMWRESLPTLAMMVPVTWLTIGPGGRSIAMWADLLYARDLCDWQGWAIAMARDIAPVLENEFTDEFALGRLLVPLAVAMPPLKSPAFLPAGR